jgi:large subunit ribosomal protein L17
MRHMIRGRQLSRDTEHRRAMRRNLIQSLFDHGKVRTTLPKAKEVRSMAEKLITLARRNDLRARRRVIAILQDRRLVDEEQEFTGQTLVQKLFSEVAPKFAGRNGGYTRIIRLSDHRIGDGGSLVLLQLCTEESRPTGTVRRSAGLRRKRNDRRHQFATKALKKGKDEKPADAPAEATATQNPPAEAPPAAQ